MPGSLLTRRSRLGSPCSLAAIDLYNIGPALQQFMDAYNKAKDNGYWKSVQISQYVCALQVGYQGSRKTTIFAGVINSYNVERRQTDSTVDTVWHLFCAGTGGYSTTPMSQSEIAESGQDYSAELQEQNQTMQSYISGEAYIKSIVMSHPRQVYTLTDMGIAFDGDSFQIQTDLDNMGLVALPKTINVTNKNFNQYFEIKYMAFNSGVEEEWTKEKDFTIKGIDNETQIVRIKFQNVENSTTGYSFEDMYGIMERDKSGNPILNIRDYNFTGDVTGYVTAAIYLQDDSGNETTKYLRIFN